MLATAQVTHSLRPKAPLTASSRNPSISDNKRPDPVRGLQSFPLGLINLVLAFYEWKPLLIARMKIIA